MTSTTPIAAFILLILWAPLPAQALLLCAKIDMGTGELKEGSVVKLRSACKTKRDGTPSEVAIGSTEELAEIRAKADANDLADVAGDVATNMTEIAGNSDRLAVLEALHSAPAPTSSPTPTPIPVGCDDPGTEWVESGDGTAKQCSSGLVWEMKTDDGSIHDKDNDYSLSTGSPWDQDGTAYSAFLPGLNTPPCFAEHCDWRLPNVDELKSILIESHPCGTNPCTTIPGETSESVYWSSSAYYSSSTYGWLVYFNNGLVNSRLRSYAHRVRAVRGGS